MKRILSYALLVVLSCSCGTAARYARGPSSADILARSGNDGIIEVVDYRCSEPGLSKRRMVIYLPPAYYEDSLKRYPVMYLLHGARGNEVTWIDYGNAFHILDSLRSEGLAEDFILVQPNMNNYRGDKDYKDGHALPAMRAFWLLDGEAERYFRQDVVLRVDSLYRTIPAKEGRAIAGMSSGALQTIHLSARYSDDFDYIGLFSPYVRPTFAAWGHPDVYGSLWRRLERQFETPPTLYNIYIGKTDFFYPHIRNFDRRLSRRGYPHKLRIAEGGHEWYNWTAFLTDFYQSVFRSQTLLQRWQNFVKNAYLCE